MNEQRHNSHHDTLGLRHQHESADLATDVQTDAELGPVGQTSDGQKVSEVRAVI